MRCALGALLHYHCSTRYGSAARWDTGAGSSRPCVGAAAARSRRGGPASAAEGAQP